jgi:VWFA-related protein
VTLIPRSHEERERRYQAEHHVILNAFVSDATGKPVRGLKQEDFTLLDNGQPHALTSFRQVKGSVGIAPVRVVLMLDAVNNSPRDIANDLKGVEQFLRQGPAQLDYETSTALLSGSGVSFGRPSRNRGDLIGELQALTKEVHLFDCTGEGGGSEQVFATFNLQGGISVAEGQHQDEKSGCLNARFLQSVSALKSFATEQQDLPGRVILIWIGRGWPLLSAREFRPDTAALRQNFFDNLVALSNALREAQVTLDTVFSPDLFRTIDLRSDHDNAYFNGVPDEDQVTASSLGLQVLAHQSGGLILIDRKDLGEEIAQCIADAESYYAMSFDSPPAAGPGEFHSIQVKMNKPGLKVRTNTVYYAEP